MKSHPIFRVICATAIALMLACHASAITVLSTSIPHPTNPNLGLEVPIVEVRGSVPFIEVNGKRVAVRAEKLTLGSGSEVEPHWIFASHLKVQQSSMGLTSSADQGFNKELVFSVDLESPVALDDVWVALGLQSEKVGDGILVQEVGSLSPYVPKTVTIHRRLSTDFGQTKYFWHVFIHGREMLHSLMNAEAVEGDMNYTTGVARSKVENADAIPYITFPPRNWPATLDRVTLKLALTAGGAVDQAAVVESIDAKSKKALLAAVNRWWFLPKVSHKTRVESQVTVTIDLSLHENWSNDFVKLVPSA